MSFFSTLPSSFLNVSWLRTGWTAAGGLVELVSSVPSTHELSLVARAVCVEHWAAPSSQTEWSWRSWFWLINYMGLMGETPWLSRVAYEYLMLEMYLLARLIWIHKFLKMLHILAYCCQLICRFKRNFSYHFVASPPQRFCSRSATGAFVHYLISPFRYDAHF
jgi:hypothetical protein